VAISSSDLEYRYSNPAASAGCQLDQDSPSASLGRYVSNSVWSGGSANDLFADISGDENADNVANYVCLFVVNKHATLTLTTTKLWLTAQVAGGASIAIGVDVTGPSALATTTQQAATISDNVSPPIGVSFSAPTSKGAGVLLGDIGPGQCRAFWIRRTAAASSALDDDGFDIRFEGESAA